MKAYVKPVLYYENFQLSQHIAACTPGMVHQNNQYSIAGIVLPVVAEQSCQVDGKVIDSYCYQTQSYTVVLSGS